MKKLTVLIVDDEPNARILLEILMQPYSKEILFAKNGEDAVESCRKNPDIDLILMDKKMPEMDGNEASVEIRKINSKVIIIILTAYYSEEEKLKLSGSGCNDFLHKPAGRDLLNNLIQKYFPDFR